MTARRSFLLRVDPDVLDAVQRWANDDLRSLNGHIEYLLRNALRDAGRLPKGERASESPTTNDEEQVP
jgi:hypothetical protein